MLLEVLCAVLVLYWTRLLWRRWRYDLHKIPSPPSWPLIGRTLDFALGNGSKQFAIYLREQLKSLGFPKLMRLEITGITVLVLSDMEYVYSVILSKTSKFYRDANFVKLVNPLFGNDENLKIMANIRELTPYVKAARKLYLTAFQSSQLKKAMPKMNQLMQKMFEIIESKREEGPIDFQKLSVQFTLDTIGLVAFDTNLGGLDGSRQIQEKAIAVGHVARANVSKPYHALFCKLFPNSKIAKEQTRILDALTSEWDTLAQEMLQKEDPPEGEMPLWYALKTMIDPETNAPPKYDSFRGELAAGVIGGMDTTGHQMGWILAMLASHPHIIDKLLEELREQGLFGENARDLTYEDLGELKYLSAVIKEGMRIVHVATGSVSRDVPEDMIILGHRVPKGTLVLVPSNRCLMSTAIWGDPEVVRPERWLTDENLSMNYFRIFSMGPRDCVGQRLAMLELRFAIVKLITKYKLSLDVSFDELLENSVDGLVIEVDGGIWLNASPRAVSNLQSS